LLMTFARQPHAEAPHCETLLVRDDSGDYSAAYQQLLKDFYLRF
jgi:hypothetical protein